MFDAVDPKRQLPVPVKLQKEESKSLILAIIQVFGCTPKGNLQVVSIQVAVIIYFLLGKWGRGWSCLKFEPQCLSITRSARTTGYPLN